jgi:phosphoribosylformylglycinamidine cyclo-ligase
MVTYKEAGVDIEAGNQAVELMKKYTRSTFNESVLGNIGGFGGFFELLDIKNYQEPVLVGSTDGVGTKLMIAFAENRHDTVGIDLVAMSVNDLICSGAKPLFFLDYIATGKMIPEKMATLVKGIADGCKQAGCALIGGETAELPGMYKPDEYDLAGFAVGIIEKKKIIDGRQIQAGDLVVGWRSSGLHSNGYSLARKVLGNEDARELLTPTKIYVQEVLTLVKKNLPLHGIANITGGGIIEKLGRIIPDNLTAEIDIHSWEHPAIFQKIQKKGQLPDAEIFRTLNMGIGMTLVVPPAIASQIPEGIIIGKITSGKQRVVLC